MALTFVDMRTEFFARGFQYLNDGATGLDRAKRWINDANQAISSLPDRWPFRQQFATGNSPLLITDLGQVEYVFHDAQNIPLTWTPRHRLTDVYGDITTAGLPHAWYLTEGANEQRIVNVFPVDGTAITVAYAKLEPVLTADANEPLMPDRFRGAIVEYAVAAALRDMDNYQEAQLAQLEGDRIVQRMREFYALMPGASDHQALSFTADDW